MKPEVTFSDWSNERINRCACIIPPLRKTKPSLRKKPGGSLAEGLAPDTYTVLVRDELDCTAMLTVEVGIPDSPTLAIASQTNANCFGDNGTLSLETEGGLAPFTYAWSPAPTS